MVRHIVIYVSKFPEDTHMGFEYKAEVLFGQAV
jgi:hypothetical protein